jgi:hypothetical protein
MKGPSLAVFDDARKEELIVLVLVAEIANFLSISKVASEFLRREELHV